MWSEIALVGLTSAQGGSLSRSVDLVEALPLLAFLDEAGLDDVVGTIVPAVGPDVSCVDFARLQASGALEKLANAVAENLVPRSDECLATPLSQLVPALAIVDESVCFGDVSTRLYNSLGRASCLNYQGISRLRLGDVAEWSGVGLRSLRELLVHVILVALLVEPTGALPAYTQSTELGESSEIEVCSNDAETPEALSVISHVSYRPSELAIALAYDDVMSGLSPRLRWLPNDGCWPCPIVPRSRRWQCPRCDS